MPGRRRFWNYDPGAPITPKQEKIPTGKPGKYGGLGMGPKGGDSEAHRKAALARWGDPEQHAKASEPRPGRNVGHTGRPGDTEGHREAALKGVAAHPESAGGGKGPRGPYKRKDKAVPQAEENRLRQEARAKFPDDEERQDAYVYGTMRSHGWRPEHHSPWDGKTYKHWWFGKMKV